MNQEVSSEIKAKKHVIKQSAEKSIIAFDRRFVDLGVGINGALMLSQAIYWTDKTNDVDGWFWKTQSGWKEELGLTIAQQRGAVKNLVEFNYLFVQRRGLPARNYYKVNLDQIIQHLRSPFSDDMSHEFDITSDNNSLHHSITENTTESTSYTVSSEKKQELSNDCTEAFSDFFSKNYKRNSNYD